ncbi:MAG: glycerol-3-phosphate acyltransferase [Armatimonadota bacterium]|nr:glycerol-3-phosphate acyltransferase [Armatimonadota bacterium]MDR7444336.1 glycerol-3-phosphate acyltransferase [Armatimonadota bacterium]MDR7614823.1 glycerol-3-phosphate acyltransferase [Armatimonadota bacterium]
MEIHEWAAGAAAYALGSVLPAEILARRLGTSLLRVGENPGGAGTWRTLGPPAGVAVVLFDMGKGAVAAWLARRVAATLEGFVLICTAPVAGHNWPLYLLFRGGRGLGPAAGVLMVLAGKPFLLAFGLGALAALRTRWVPTVGIVALPTYLGLLLVGGYPPRELAAAAAVSLTVAVRQLPWVWGRLQEWRRPVPGSP